jgi:DNA-binding NarL/FixJ family response regulator
VIRVAIVGASPHVRGEIDAGLRELGGFDVVLHAPSLADARALGFGRARVAIVDAGSLGDDDVDAESDGPALVVLAGRTADLHAWWQGGASLLDADASTEQVAAAAQAAAAGLRVCPPALAAALGAPAARSAAPGYEPLTPRESQVLQQMSFGLGNREIAAALGISAHTAKFHVAQVIAKLDASSRAHAVANALRAGLVDATA